MNDVTRNGGGNIGGPELYHAVQRLICEWSGQDAAHQGAAMPRLVSDIVQLVNGHTADAARAAAHDDAQAA